MGKFLDPIIHLSHDITDKRAARNPLWKERRDKRRTDKGTIRFLDDEFSMEMWDEEHEIWEGYKPWWGKAALHLKWWLEAHGIRVRVREWKHGRQRAKRGFSDRDIWGFDHFLAETIRDGCLELDRIKHGWPGESNGVKTFEEWGQILRDIADGMQASIDLHDYLTERTTTERTILEKKFKKSMRLLTKYWFHLWD